ASIRQRKIGDEVVRDRHLFDRQIGNRRVDVRNEMQASRPDPRGELPRDILDVMAWHKDIAYSSRTRYTTDLYRRLLKWKTRLLHALEKVFKELLSDEERGVYNHLSTMPQITILQLIYQQKAYEGHAL